MHAQILKLMGATEIIFPEKDIAEWIATRLSEPNLIERIPLSEDYSIVEYACRINLQVILFAKFN